MNGTKANTYSEHTDGRIPQTGLSPELLDVRAVAVLLGDCSIRHIYRLADGGRMPPPVKLGNLVRWRRAELEAWISAGCPSRRPEGRRS
jgi:excisionase family DNA binding protein